MLQDQKQASIYRGLPIDDSGASSSLLSITGETVQLYYSNAGVLTADAGQAAGVAVLGTFAYDMILNAIGSALGRFGDCSCSFTSTALTSEVFVPPEEWEKYDALLWPLRLSTITSGFSNGQYAIDRRNGVIYGKKASITTTLTATAYKVPVRAQVVSGGIAGGAADAGAPIKVGGVYNLVRPTYTSGNRTDLQANVNGGILTQPESYDTASSADKTSLIRDVSDQFVPTVLQPSASLAAATYYYYLYMDGFSHAAFNVDIGANTTVTYEMTFDDPSGSPTYYDRTVTGYWANATAQGIGATSFTATHSMWFDDVNCRAVRVKVVVASGTPTTYITAKQVY